MQYLIRFVPTLLITASATAWAEPPPWKVHTPIVEVHREVYLLHNKSGFTTYVWNYHVGPGLEREEVHLALADNSKPWERKRRRTSRR